LTHHSCINLRLPTYGGLYAWEFDKGGDEIRVRVDGQFAFNGVPQALAAALDGYGLAYLHETFAGNPLLRDGWSRSSGIGVRRSPATTFIIRAAGNRHPPSPC
jgi:DNA-binding transcriptional LysR family regulator